MITCLSHDSLQQLNFLFARSNNINVTLPSELAIACAAVWYLLTFIVNFAFAFAVAFDSGMLPRGRRTILVGRFMWFLATLFGGVFVAGLYWLMHRSTLSPAVRMLLVRDSKQADTGFDEN